MFTLRQFAAALCVAGFATLAATSATAATVDDEFGAAMQNYDDCRYAIAYVGLAGLADGGHAEAARIALLMVRYGPQLYGGQWSASSYQIENWMRLASSRQANFIAAAAD